HRVPWGQHAVTRNRALAAAVLGYAITGDPDYGIAAPAFPPNPQEDDSPADDDRPWLDPASRYTWAPPAPYAVLLHGTSAERKQWPEHQWKKLAAQLGATGVACVLPWGSDAEHARSESIAQNVPHAIVPPRLGLRTLSGLLGHARVVVGVDTGLTHLAAALRTPTVGIYVATEPAATGVLAPGFGVNLGGKGRTVTLASVLGTIRDVTT
ncbi:MAG: hypothetical protein KIT73_18540, partial [Burkholderiales bacterium]|nr:hypothetical protein [Burkholderiales bacterium]